MSSSAIGSVLESVLGSVLGAYLGHISARTSNFHFLTSFTYLTYFHFLTSFTYLTYRSRDWGLNSQNEVSGKDFIVDLIGFSSFGIEKTCQYKKCPNHCDQYSTLMSNGSHFGP